MSFARNIEFINRINTTMVEIMKDGKIDNNDIPRIVLLITDLITFSGKSEDDGNTLSSSITELYEYIMGHYKLFPEDEVLKTEFKTLFDTCIKLALYQPSINTAVNSALSCFCVKRS